MIDENAIDEWEELKNYFKSVTIEDLEKDGWSLSNASKIYHKFKNGNVRTGAFFLFPRPSFSIILIKVKNLLSFYLNRPVTSFLRA